MRAPVSGSAETLESQIELMKAQNRRMAVWFALMTLTLLLFMIAGISRTPNANDVIRVKRLEVVDNDGKAVIVISAFPKEDPDTGPYIAFLDERGKTRLMLSSGRAVGTGFSILSRDGKMEVLLRATPDTGTKLMLLDGNMPRAALGLLKDKSSELILKDETGHTHASVRVSSGGDPKLEIRDKNGKTIFKKP